MREATGDLNMTVIVVIAVAGLMAFFSMTLWPMIKGGLKHDANCSDAICVKSTINENAGTIECHMKGSSETFTCPYKG